MLTWTSGAAGEVKLACLILWTSVQQEIIVQLPLMSEPELPAAMSNSQTFGLRHAAVLGCRRTMMPWVYVMSHGYIH